MAGSKRELVELRQAKIQPTGHLPAASSAAPQTQIVQRQEDLIEVVYNPYCERSSNLVDRFGKERLAKPELIKDLAPVPRLLWLEK